MPKSLEIGVEEWIDPDDAPELTSEWFKDAVWEVNGVPVRSREQAFSDANPVELRFKIAPELADYFRTSEEGWEDRLSEALREAVRSRQERLYRPV